MEEFLYRSLESESELAPWLDHVVECFAEKGTPRDYFERHWAQDPFKSLAGILIATAGSSHGQPLQNAHIASSVRVYRRDLFVRGQRLAVGGIGEVSTKKEFRGKGLASVLMQKAIEFMANNQIQLGALHTSNPATADFYRSKLAWTPVPLTFSLHSLPSSALQDTLARLKAASSDTAVFQLSAQSLLSSSGGSDARWRAVMDLHWRAARTMSGSFARWPSSSEDGPKQDVSYWTQWIRSEVEARRESFVLGVERASGTGGDGGLLAYGIFNVRPHPANPTTTLLVHARDFLIDDSCSPAPPHPLFPRLALEAVGLWKQSQGDAALHEPTTLLLKVQSGLIRSESHLYAQTCSFSNVEQSRDTGYMYKVVKPDVFLAGNRLSSEQPIDQAVVEFFTKGDPLNHVFLEMDAY